MAIPGTLKTRCSPQGVSNLLELIDEPTAFTQKNTPFQRYPKLGQSFRGAPGSFGTSEGPRDPSFRPSCSGGEEGRPGKVWGLLSLGPSGPTQIPPFYEIAGRPLCPSVSSEVTGRVRHPPCLYPELCGPSRAGPGWFPSQMVACQEGTWQILPSTAPQMAPS